MAVADEVAALKAGVDQLAADAFAAGVASVGAGDITPEQEALDIAAAVAPLNAQIAALQLAKADEDALLAQVKSSVAALQTLLA